MSQLGGNDRVAKEDLGLEDDTFEKHQRLMLVLVDEFAQ